MNEQQRQFVGGCQCVICRLTFTRENEELGHWKSHDTFLCITDYDVISLGAPVTWPEAGRGLHPKGNFG